MMEEDGDNGRWNQMTMSSKVEQHRRETSHEEGFPIWSNNTVNKGRRTR